VIVVSLGELEPPQLVRKAQRSATVGDSATAFRLSTGEALQIAGLSIPGDRKFRRRRIPYFGKPISERLCM
jgi:hypothetical protein